MASIIVHAPPAVIGDEITGRVRRIRGQRSHYTCAYCEKVFKRSEHRIRHERTHTNEKPFSCRYCRRSYSRKDLVTRHERTLHAQGQTEPCALPAVSIGVDGDGSSDGSLSDVGDALSARRSRDDAAATSILDADRPLSESGASPASSANRVGAAALVSLSNHVPSADDEDCMGTSSVMEQTLDQPSLHEPSMAQAMVSGGRARRLTSLSDAPSTVHLGGHQPDIYTQDRFDLYDASPQMPMDVDHDQGQRHEGYQNITQQPHSKTQQHRPEQPPEFHAFSQFDSEALSGGIVMNQGSDVGQLPTTFEHVDMSSYFAFSPFPAGLFEAGQNMPNISSIPDIFEYPGLSNPIPSRMDPAITPVSALPPHSPSEHLPGTDAARSSESDALGARQTPSNLPRLVKDKPPRIPSFVADDALHASICKDLAERLGSPDVSQEVPSSKLLQGFLASFMECYYRHQPFIHLPTLSTVDSPSPLTLAMCCIGALYRLDRRRAQRLYAIGTQSIETDIQRFIKSSEDTLPLWVAQTKLLFTAYAALSGDKDLTQKVMNENGFYTLVYNKVRLSLAAENADINKMTWDSWVRRESWKRLLGGIYVASTVHVIIWDTNPGFNTSQDLDLEVLHDESLWNAKTATEWSELRTNQPHQEYRTLRDGLASIMSDSSADSPRIAACRLSPFTALLLMHAVVVHVWQVVQVAQSLAPTSPPGHDPASSLLMSAAVRSLARSHELLVIAARSEEAEGEPGHHHDEGTSQIFNCQATLRMAYIRLFSDASGGVAARPSLMTTSSDPAAAKAFASSLAVTRLERSPQLLDAVVKAFEGLRIPVRMGHMLVRKTAALRWSPAHAIAGWDCALFVCKWVHSVEMDRLNDIEPSQAECEFLATIREVLEEAEYDPENSKSLAAGVARTWSFLLQDVWVWSITPRMGAVLEQMAAAFERVNDANRRQGE